MNPHFTIVISTNRKNSLTNQLAHHYSMILAKHQIQTDLIDLKDLPDSFLTNVLYQKEYINEDFTKMQQTILKNQKIVFIIPEYNGSFPGILKTFIDALQFPISFQNKKCALIGLSAGRQGCIIGISHLLYIFNYLGMITYPRKVFFSNVQNINMIIQNQQNITLLEKQIKGFAKF